LGLIEDIFNPFLKPIAPLTPPGSSLFIIVVALLVSMTSTLISRRLIDIDKLKRYTRETKEFQSLRMKALRTQDRRIMKKVEDNTKRVEKMQRELASMRFKPLLITFIPLIVVFIAMNGYYGGGDAIVGNIPFSLPEMLIFFRVGYNCTGIQNGVENGDVIISDITGAKRLCAENTNLVYMPTYIGWYFAVNITIGAIIQKLAGLTPD
jgi:uncharacterized membrane protein (DUF106 family)